MSYSAQTEKLRLPQWVKGSKDHPDFLTDVNQAFEKIDGFAQGIDNTVDGLPEQVEEVATILQSVQEDVGEHTEELARQSLRIGVLENKVDSTNGLTGRVAALEDGQREQDEKISGVEERVRATLSIAPHKAITERIELTGHVRNTTDVITVLINAYRIGMLVAISMYPTKGIKDYLKANIDLEIEIPSSEARKLFNLLEVELNGAVFHRISEGKQLCGEYWAYGVAYSNHNDFIRITIRPYGAQRPTEEMITAMDNSVSGIYLVLPADN